ncbi:MAG TPA: outer membrane lipoprotein carrier protein LolA [Anaeromyxobacter sp.]|nr:outer membrane lipoprotein carrier protein LolA [Anaeromyxobacter sp.]
MRVHELRRVKDAALVALVLAIPLATASGRDAEARSLADVLDAHCRAREATVTLRARFVQTRVLTAIGEEERSAGELYYRKPDRLRWEYSTPDRSWTVIAGDRGWAVFPRIRQVQRFEVGRSRADGILSTIGFGACGPAFSDSFDTTLAAGARGAPVLSMTPRRPELAASFTRIELTLDPKDHLPRDILLHETSGDMTRIELSEVRRGVAIEGSLFQFTAPEGYSVVP